LHRLKYREDIVDGLAKAPAAFISMLQSELRQDAGKDRGVTTIVTSALTVRV
jgi:NADPH-dependent curcumin reductase CurA